MSNLTFDGITLVKSRMQFSEEALSLIRQVRMQSICYGEEGCIMEQKKIFAKELGIDLSSKQETAYFKWFLACLLFGKPIQQEVAKRTYFEFVNEHLVTPDAILKAGWDRLV